MIKVAKYSSLLQAIVFSLLLTSSITGFFAYQQARRIGYAWLNNRLMEYSVQKPIIVYASWNQLKDHDRMFFQDIVGGSLSEAQVFYNRYFLTYNLIHEAFHGLRALYGLCSITNGINELFYQEEAIVNILAIAYWKEQSPDLVAKLESQLTSILSRLEDPTPKDSSPEKYILEQMQMGDFDPRAYGYYQFSMVMDAINQNLSLEEALVTYLGNPHADAIEVDITLEDLVPRELPDHIVSHFLHKMTVMGYEVPAIRLVNQYFPYIQFILVAY